MRTIKYSIVIPTYNHCEDLLKPCIESIFRNTDIENIEIIVVANGCVDNTKEYVEGLLNTTLLWFDDAIGYTKATNAGIKVAKGEYVLLLNNDTVILDYCAKNQWLNRLTEPFINNQNMAITGPVRYNEPAINKDFLIFFCVLIKRTIFDKVGLLDEIFSPGYGEDIDFCMRVKNAGFEWNCVVDTQQKQGMHTGNFPLYHAGTATFKNENNYHSVVMRNKQILRDRYYNVQ